MHKAFKLLAHCYIDENQMRYLKMKDNGKYLFRSSLHGIGDALNLEVTKFDRAQKAREEGRLIVKTGLNAPHELFVAANAYSVFFRVDEEAFGELIRGQYGLQNMIDRFGLGQGYRFDLCSSAGSPCSSPCGRHVDIVTTDFPAKRPEWSVFMDQLRSEHAWNFFPLEVPRGLTRTEAFKLIVQKLERLRAELETAKGEEITDDDIRGACEKTNRVREHVKKMDELLKADPMPITGSDVFWAHWMARASYIGGEVEIVSEIMESLVVELEELVDQGVSAYDGDVSRLLLIPSGNAHRRMQPVLEKNGGAFVADWPGDSGTKIQLNGDPIKSLAKHYINTQGLFDSTEDVKDILEIIKCLNIDGIIYSQTPDEYGYAAITESMEDICSAMMERGVPVMFASPELLENERELNTEVKEFIMNCREA